MYHEEFQYDGYLVFNSILRIRRKDNSKFQANELLDELQSVNAKTTSEDVIGGFEHIPLSDYDLSSSLSSSASDFYEQVHQVIHKDISFEKITGVDNENNTKELEVQRVNSIDCYLIDGEFIIIRGSKQDADTVTKEIKRSLEEIAYIEEMNFSQDFLLWCLYQYESNNRRVGNLELRQFTDAEFSGEESDVFGQVARVSDSNDITRSAPAITSILRGISISSLGGIFLLEQHDEIFADISDDGRVHVKANSGDIKAGSDLYRIIHSLKFALEVVDIYTEWIDKPGEEKYPPAEFFEHLYGKCEQEGVRLTFSADEIIEEYLSKRQEP